MLRPTRATHGFVWARVLAITTLAAAVGCWPPSADRGGVLPLDYLATAEQLGPVAYRDPLGAVSPDGRWLAYVEQDRVHVMPVAGGATRVIGPGTSSIRFLTWLPDNRTLAVRERVFDRSRQEWWLYDRIDGGRSTLWPERQSEPDLLGLDMLAWSADGSRVAGVVRVGGQSTVWVLDSEGGSGEAHAIAARLTFPAWSPDGRLACLSVEGEAQFLRFPCDEPTPLFTDQEAYGPVAFSPAGQAVYYASPGEGGFLDVWSRSTSDGSAPLRLTGFARDAYAPSADEDGTVILKSQDYRVFLATAPSEGGVSTPLTSFQAETPTWSWDGSEVAFTFGSWRHVTDDFHYPDIAQDIGVVSTDAESPRSEPDRIIRQSSSEDQAMHWSPNGRWIVFHTHEESDDVWLVAADGSTEPRMISEGGSETGWPRWSRDGRWIVFPSYRQNEDGGRRAHLFVIGVDEETGEVTAPQTRVELTGFSNDVVQGVWADEGNTLVFEAAAGIGDKSLWTVPRTGGTPTRFHSFSSDQIHSGIGVSPDGRWTAYIDRAQDGFFQVFRVPVGGGESEQLTFDPSHKTQPIYSPVGDRLAFTVFSYRVHFWRVVP